MGNAGTEDVDVSVSACVCVCERGGVSGPGSNMLRVGGGPNLRPPLRSSTGSAFVPKWISMGGGTLNVILSALLLVLVVAVPPQNPSAKLKPVPNAPAAVEAEQVERQGEASIEQVESDLKRLSTFSSEV